MVTPVTVTIPVGPYEANKRWLPEAIESVRSQITPIDEILVINDQANLSYGKFGKGITVWKTPWLSGVAHAFNYGVALAKNELVFMLGSDDYLAPECVARCVDTWKKNEQKDGYYYVHIRYLDDREDPDQDLPCGAAMVTKGLWRLTGGFPLQAALGQSDTMLVSILWKHRPDLLVGVHSREPMYFYRPHEESDTSSKGPWQGVLLETRDLVTDLWKPRSD